MSRARDRRRRLGAYWRPDWRTPHYDAFLKKTLAGYTWPMTKMMFRRSGIVRFMEQEGIIPREPLSPAEQAIALQCWAKREEPPF